MIHLFKDPKGETVLDPSSTGDTCTTIVKTSVPMTEVPNQVDGVTGLKQQISQLEKKLAEVIMFFNDCK